MTDLNTNDKLLAMLQRGIDISPRPFAKIAESLQISEDEVVKRTQLLMEEGIIRRLGGVWNSAALGFKSSLFALNATPQDITAIADKLNSDPGITHSYVREGKPNLWFTLTAHKSEFERKVAALEISVKPLQLFAMPAVKHFKVQVIFDKSEKQPASIAPRKHVSPIELSEKEKEIVKYFQSSIPFTVHGYKKPAGALGYSEDELISKLENWISWGVLKRVAAIIRHTRFGFKGNSMCVWSISPDKANQLGLILANRPEVSHCCMRESCSEFPFNLYAMIHASDEELVKSKFEEISEIIGNNGKMLMSVKELKKTSPVYF
ncbi:MAG: Lrp/AsnC family transcriptional regulator [Lentisphaerae bacterium]|nr:Lrp/AsnC family transcriptional regulator [Lentisphaerota bacterium]